MVLDGFFLQASITVIAYSSLIAIEVEAGRQYAAAWFPSLTKAGSSSPTVTGWLVQFGLLCLFFLLNYWSVKTFAKSNTIVPIFKFFVLALTIVVLLTHLKSVNFSIHGFAPSGFRGIESAISIGGLTPIVAVDSEAKNPQRTIPVA